MERTNYIEKAKKLMLQTARTAALVIVPLAAAVSAHAGSIIVVPTPSLPTGNFSCSNCMSGGDTSVANSPINGVSFYGTAQSYTSGGTSGGYPLISFYDGGLFSGTLPSSMPVDWDFSLTADPTLTVTSWSLTFSLSGSATGIVTESGSGTGTFSGSDSFSISPSGFVSGSLYEQVTLDVSTSGTGGLVVDVFQGSSFDFNGVTTPEPASLGLIASGLALLGGLVRRRRKQS